ncbi:MAG: hypothetical protein JSW11_04630 [Candidatus Heimdallarchaeota archaeon]|nr:MAG: hypothetical protein JSW11_04630 [Candidatus Heimdallarchaeota archaeon]
MQKDPIQRDEVIKQLVCQQFFIRPNLITDRTHRLQIEIQGAEHVFLHLSDFLYDLSLKGTDPTPNEVVLEEAAIFLQINPKLVLLRFHEKTHVFLREGLATEDILFITTISSILEVFDTQQFEKLVDQLYDSYIQLCIHKIPARDDNDISRHFFAGIRRLGEIADPNFSLLHNVLKCVTLAKLFQIHINHDQSLIQEYFQIVMNKIISGGI